MYPSSYVKLVIQSRLKPRPLTICRARRMFPLAHPCHFLLFGSGEGKRNTERNVRGRGGQSHMSSLPGPEPCCWLHRSLSQPRTKISLDTASDRLAPAALAGRRRRTQTHRKRAVISPVQPVSYTSQTADFFQPGCLSQSPPTATGPWGSAKSPRR